MEVFSSNRLAVCLLLVGILFVDSSCSLRCYSGGVSSNNIIDNCSGSCMQVIQRGEIKRGCSAVRGADVCDAAPAVTVCYCKTDLCNTAGDSRQMTSLTTLLPAIGVLLYKLF